MRNSYLVIASAGMMAVACTTSSQSSTTKIAIAHSPAATSPGAVSTSPSARAVVAADLNCKIGISSGAPGSGGFISFPDGAFTPDPSSSIGAGGQLSYLRGQSKWVASQRSAVSPDGLQYATTGSEDVGSTYEETVRTVDVHSGLYTDTALSSDARNVRILGYEASGVYAAAGAGYGGPSSLGLYFVPVSNGSVNGPAKEISSVNYWQAEGNGAAWGTVTTSVPQGATSTIQRLDLSSNGSPEDWFSEVGRSSTVIGFDSSGEPIVTSSDGTNTDISVVTGKQAATKIYSFANSPSSISNEGVPAPAPTSNPFSLNGDPVADTNGVWFGTTQGLYLYASGQFAKMSPIAGEVAGGCA